MLALGLRFGAMALLATLSLLVKLAGQSGIALPEIMFWRQALTIPLVLVGLAAAGRLSSLRSERLPAHAVRAAIGNIGMFCNFAAVIALPLAEATVLGFTTPLFAVILGVLLMRQTVGRWRIAAVLLGFVGVLIIAQPGGSPLPPLGAAAGVASGFMVALISFQIRDLARTEAPLTIVFWFSTLSAPVLALFLPFYATHHTGAQWLLLMAIGVTGIAAQFLLSAALRYGAVISVIVMDYTALIWAALYGWALWGQAPTQATWLGAPIIVVAGLMIAWREHKLAKAQSPTSALLGD